MPEPAGTDTAAGGVPTPPADPEALYRQIGPRFSRSEVRTRLRRYVEGLLGYAQHKNCWRLAEYAGERTPDGMQRLLSTSRWDANAVRDDLREYVVAQLTDGTEAVVIGEIGFRRRGPNSAGVQRQWNPCTRRVENCQVGVFLAYASSKGRALIDRELFLSEEWAADARRREKALIPETVVFTSKSQLALRMLRRAWEAGVPAAWVVGGETHGADEALRSALEARGQPYVFRISPDHRLDQDAGSQTCGAVAELIVPAEGWWSEEDSGGQTYDWARVPLIETGGSAWNRWLLLRRSAATPADLAYHAVFAPGETPLAEMVRAAKLKRAVRESGGIAKAGAGLDGYEVRHWDGWYRHITLALVAHALLVLGQAQAAGDGTETGTPAGKGAAPAATSEGRTQEQ